MKNKQFFILILLLVIGFASISATLIINGNTKVAANLDDFNVIFIEGFLNGETNEDVVISEDKKTLTFRTNTLTDINDIARIDYKVKNISTQYDGDVTINCTNEANEYVNVTSSFDGKTLPLIESVNMQAQEIKNGCINAELTKATTEYQEVKITCKIEVSAISRTNYAYSLSFDSNGGTNVEDKVVEYNNSYGELEEPTKEGYTFIGWFNEEDIKVNESTILDTKGNKTLTAKWAEKAYPVEIKKVYSDKTETSEINIPFGKSINEQLAMDEKSFISSIECTNGYTAEKNNKEDVIFGEQTIKINNNHMASSSSCTITISQGIYEYSYNGYEQNLIIPCNGRYKLETWGAQGGTYNTTYYGGYGAYSTGIINLSKNTTLFINVGGAGSGGGAVIATYQRDGGYNGGGSGARKNDNNAQTSYNGGGGATHIAEKSGLLSTLSDYISKILIVSSGGGGASYYYRASNQVSYGSGGSGGGYVGTPSTRYSNVFGSISTTTLSEYSTQDSGYSFGLGSSANDYYNALGSAGSGGGYYGGVGAHDFPGGGGSSYIGNSRLTNKAMYCYNCTQSSDEAIKTISTACTNSSPTSNCAKQGNGYAKITYLGK